MTDYQRHEAKYELQRQISIKHGVLIYYNRHMFVRKLTSSIFCIAFALTPLVSSAHAYDLSKLTRMTSVGRYPVGYDPDKRTRPQFVKPLKKLQRTDNDNTHSPSVYMHGPGQTPPPSPRRVNANSPVTAEERSRFYNLIAQTSLASLGVMDPDEAYTAYAYLQPPQPPEPSEPPETTQAQDAAPELGIYRPQIQETRFHGRHNRRWQPPRGYDPRKRKSVDEPN